MVFLRMGNYLYDGNRGHWFQQPGAVARSDARPPGIGMVAGSILTSGNILSWSLVVK